jgi:hypothetical protein
MAQIPQLHLIYHSNLRYAYGIKRKDGEAYTNLLQLIIKFVLFKYLINPPNSSQLLLSPTIKIIVLSLYRMPQKMPQKIPQRMPQRMP